MAKKGSYDYFLILATVGVLFIVSLICIGSMFYFKWAQVQQMTPALKAGYMDRMNTVVAPFIILLILLLGICVPKRLLPTAWLNRFAAALTAVALLVAACAGVKEALLVVLLVALALQGVVLVLAIAGSGRLHFERSGYWVRLGSSLTHLGLILFVFDLFFYDRLALHLLLFWVTTASTVLGLAFCFYADAVTGLLRGAPQQPEGE